MEAWTRTDALKVRDILQKLDLCPCGSSTEFECVLELLTEAENHTREGFYRNKWVEFGAKVLDSKGLLEHGTSIGFAWLTYEGGLLLRFLRDFGTDGHTFDDGSGHPEWSIVFNWSEKEDEHDSFGYWQKRIVSGAVT